MAGTVITGDVVTFGATAITHVTAWTINEQANAITQEVADQTAALSAAGNPVVTVTVSFVVPASGGATLLGALDAGDSGALSIAVKDGVGGSTLHTWTAADSANESQGVSVAASAGSMTIATVNFSTNGGSWA